MCVSVYIYLYITFNVYYWFIDMDLTANVTQQTVYQLCKRTGWGRKLWRGQERVGEQGSQGARPCPWPCRPPRHTHRHVCAQTPFPFLSFSSSLFPFSPCLCSPFLSPSLSLFPLSFLKASLPERPPSTNCPPIPPCSRAHTLTSSFILYFDCYLFYV